MEVTFFLTLPLFAGSKKDGQFNHCELCSMNNFSLKPLQLNWNAKQTFPYPYGPRPWMTKLNPYRKFWAHPSWMCLPTIFVTREVVYYILSGTPRSAQKYFWSNLGVEFSGENHLLLIWGKIPNQIFWITKNLDSGFNSDLFKKKICPNWTCLDCFR